MTTLAAVPNEPDEPREDDDFLAFWRSVEAENKPETRRILGVEVRVPADLPLKFEQVANDLGASSDEEDVKELLTVLFGRDPLDAWVEAGITGRQFQVILAWGVANGQGKPTSFAEALELVREAERADAEGKAPVVPNRADRRASSATRASAAAGRSSSRTTAASTKSPRKRSRT